MLIANFILLVSLCLHYVLCMPTGTETGEEWVYLIEVNTSVANTLNSYISSEWFLEGKLTIQSFKDYKIMKLTRVKSGSYNGPRNPNYSEHPGFETENGLQLSQPFVVYYNNSLIDELGFNPEDPTWSTNIKKAIATVFQYDVSIKDGTEDTVTEKSIHGICDVLYLRDDVLIKEFKQCQREGTQNEKENTFGNNYYERETMRTYTLNDNNIPTNIRSTSSHSIQEHSDENIEQKIYQSIRFENKLFQAVQTPIDIKDCTVRKQPQFEYEITVEEQTTNETIDYFIKQIEHLEEEMKLNSTENTDETFQTIENIHQILSRADLSTLKSFLEPESDEQNFTSKIVSSMLPFIGSNNSVQLIKELYQQHKFTDLTGFLTLVKYPIYVKNISENLIQELSELLDSDEFNVPNDLDKLEERHIIVLTAKNNYILGFSNFVRRMYKQNENNSSLIQSYVDKYCQMYLDPKLSRSQMTIILGLGNMGRLATDCLLDIANNPSQNRHLRSRAMYAIGSTLTSKNGAFTSIWPIVENAGNPYELRLAALSVLLHKHIEHPETIYQYLKKFPDDVANQHIYHYFYTFMQSRINTDNGELVDDFEMNPPVNTRGTLTGFYHLRSQDSQTNSKFMSITNIHVIAEPTSNVVKSVHVSFEHKQKQKHSRYTAVIKLEGVRLFNFWPGYRPTDDNFEVLDMVKENKLKQNYIREEEYLEIIVYDEEDRPIFAIDINLNIWDNRKLVHFFMKQIHYFINNDFVTSEEDRSIVASDLGTQINIITRNERMYHGYSNIVDEINNIFYRDSHNIEAEFKSLDRQSINLESVNPILDINHGVTKFSTKQYILNFSPVLNFNTWDPFFKWNDEDLKYENLYEFKHAAYVGYDPVVSKYCKDCTHVEFYKLPEDKNTHIHMEVNLGAKVLDIMALQCTFNNPMSEFVPKMLNKFSTRNKQLPLLQPFLLLKYIQDYVQFNSMYDICSFSVSSQSNTELIVPYWTKVELSYHRDRLEITLSNFRQLDDTRINSYNIALETFEIYQIKSNFTYKSENSNETFKVELGVSYQSEQRPSWKNNWFCTEFPEPSLVNIDIKYLDSNENENFAFNVSNSFSVSEYKKKQLSESEQIIECLKGNTSSFNVNTLRGNFAPTRECFEACLYISSYDNFTTNIEFKEYSPTSRFGILLNSVVMAPFDNQDKMTEDENIIDRLAQKLDNPFKKSDTKIEVKQVSFTYVQKNPVTLSVNNGELNTSIEIPREFEPEVLPRPLERLWDDSKFSNLGWDSVCIITPNYVKTFTARTIEFPSLQRLQTNLAVIDCGYQPQTSFLFSRTENNKLEFKIWTGKHTVESHYGEFKFNNETAPIMRDYNFKLESLGDNRTYITTRYFNVYSNMDYIAIKMSSNLVNQMCGICSTGVFTATNKYSIQN